MVAWTAYTALHISWTLPPLAASTSHGVYRHLRPPHLMEPAGWCAAATNRIAEPRTLPPVHRTHAVTQTASAWSRRHSPSWVRTWCCTWLPAGAPCSSAPTDAAAHAIVPTWMWPPCPLDLLALIPNVGAAPRSPSSSSTSQLYLVPLKSTHP
jgi:hypothetical protein